MALQASLTFNGLLIPAAYVRVDRLFGSKREGWTAVVGLYVDQAHADGQPLSSWNVSAAYVADQAPYVSLYAAAMTDLNPRFGCALVLGV